mmetsp:Transcript_6458/g.16248  ORF Transcript_6458/g.16248 Transcript_6458/m.16248 type:complete len:257 (+) Transcript_6458:702-1472(+)
MWRWSDDYRKVSAIRVRTRVCCAQQSWSVVLEQQPSWVIVERLSPDRGNPVDARLVDEHVQDTVKAHTLVGQAPPLLASAHGTEVLRGARRFVCIQNELNSTLCRQRARRVGVPRDLNVEVDVWVSWSVTPFLPHTRFCHGGLSHRRSLRLCVHGAASPRTPLALAAKPRLELIGGGPGLPPALAVLLRRAARLHAAVDPVHARLARLVRLAMLHAAGAALVGRPHDIAAPPDDDGAVVLGVRRRVARVELGRGRR